MQQERDAIDALLSAEREREVGFKLMPEMERLGMVRSLEMSRAEGMLQLQKMPLQLQTVGQFARKQQLEDKLKEVEQALVTFNKPEIYVALDCMRGSWREVDSLGNSWWLDWCLVSGILHYRVRHRVTQILVILVF